MTKLTNMYQKVRATIATMKKGITFTKLLSLFMLVCTFCTPQVVRAQMVSISGLIDNVVMADVNGDGLKDLVHVYTTNGALSMQVELADSSGELIAQGTYQTGDYYGGQPFDVLAADVNGDGRDDLVHVRTDNGYLIMKAHLSAGNGGFSAQGWYQTGDAYNGLPFNVITADVNGDGRKDLVLIRTKNEQLIMKAYLADGTGGFSTGSSSFYQTGDYYGGQPFTVLAADVNGDGRDDLVHVRTDSQKLIMKVHLSNGNGGFSAQGWYQTGDNYGEQFSVLAADVNGDGRDDLVHVRTDSQKLIVKVHLANGTGGFSAQGWYQTGDYYGGQPFSVLAADVNGDGRYDLIHLRTDNGHFILKTHLATGLGGFIASGWSQIGDAWNYASIVNGAFTAVVSAETDKAGSVRVEGVVAPNAMIFWDGDLVARANSTGKFIFQTDRVPEDCVGRLKEGKNALSVTIAGCQPADWRPKDVIVLFDDQSIEEQAASVRVASKLTINDKALTDFKAQQYVSLKSGVKLLLDEGEASLQKGTAKGATLVQDYSHLPALIANIRTLDTLRAIAARSEVAGIYRTRKYHSTLTESLPLIGLTTPADVSKRDPKLRGGGTAVAVIDTGVDFTKSAFGSCSKPGVPSTPGSRCAVVYAADFAPDDSQNDDNGHGTNVAGIVLGVAPDTDIIALDVFSPKDGRADDQDVMAGINWVIANQAKYNIVAMNLSLGEALDNDKCDLFFDESGACNGDILCQLLHNEGFHAKWEYYKYWFARARAVGIAPIVAAGNDGVKRLEYPACASGAISVGAVYDTNVGSQPWPDAHCTDTVTAADKVACFSNSDSSLRLLAPGSVISAAGISKSGTSMAAPHVAGAWAILRSYYDTVNPTHVPPVDSVLYALQATGMPIQDPKSGITTPRIHIDNSTLGALSNHAGTLQNGLECQVDADCESSRCFPSPGNGERKFCMAEEENCAWPGSDGGLYGDGARLASPSTPPYVFVWVDKTWDGFPVMCMNPGADSRARYVYYPFDRPAPGRNGALCQENSDCLSGFCFPGPGLGEREYCMDSARNCAWPGTDGYMYGRAAVYEGRKVQCMNPGSGSRARFAYP